MRPNQSIIKAKAAAMFMQCVLPARSCVKSFTCIIFYNPHHRPIKEETKISDLKSPAQALLLSDSELKYRKLKVEFNLTRICHLNRFRDGKSRSKAIEREVQDGITVSPHSSTPGKRNIHLNHNTDFLVSW